MTLKIINEGKGHRWPFNHNWIQVEDDWENWDEEKLEKCFEEIDDFAVFRSLFRCRCGAEAVYIEVSYI